MRSRDNFKTGLQEANPGYGRTVPSKLFRAAKEEMAVDPARTGEYFGKRCDV